MAALTGNSVASSYQGILKTTNNAAISGTQQKITDGEGNDTPLSMSSSTLQVSATNIELVESTGGNNLINIDATKINFEGDVDFTYATVTGIGGGGGSAGLVNGTGSDSLTVDSTLVTNTPEATGLRSIAIGDGAKSRADDCIVIGNGVVDDAIRVGSVVIGSNSFKQTKAAQYSTAVGSGTQAIGSNCLSLGNGITVAGNYSVGLSGQFGLTMPNNESVWIGAGSGTTFGFGSKGIKMGWDSKEIGTNSNAIGRAAKATGSWSSALAYNAQSTGEQSTAVSYGAVASAQGTFAACG